MEGNYDGDYQRVRKVWAVLRGATPPHSGADAHEVDTLYWLVDHASGEMRWDEAITRLSERAVSLGEAPLEEDPSDFEARFYLAQARIELARLAATARNAPARTWRASWGSTSITHPRFRESSHGSSGSGWFPPATVSWLLPTWKRLDAAATWGGQMFRRAATLTVAGVYAAYEERAEEALPPFAPVRARHPDNAYRHAQWVSLLMLLGEYAGGAGRGSGVPQ